MILFLEHVDLLLRSDDLGIGCDLGGLCFGEGLLGALDLRVGLVRRLLGLLEGLVDFPF